LWDLKEKAAWFTWRLYMTMSPEFMARKAMSSFWETEQATKLLLPILSSFGSS
jgi:hypothetical protein